MAGLVHAQAGLVGQGGVLQLVFDDLIDLLGREDRTDVLVVAVSSASCRKSDAFCSVSRAMMTSFSSIPHCVTTHHAWRNQIIPILKEKFCERLRRLHRALTIH